MHEPPVKLLIRKGGHGNCEWRQRAGMAAQAHALDAFLPATRPGWPRRTASRPKGLLVTAAPKSKGAVAYSATGMSKAGIASASWTSTVLAGSLPRLGVSFETAPLAKDDSKSPGRWC